MDNTCIKLTEVVNGYNPTMLYAQYIDTLYSDEKNIQEEPETTNRLHGTNWMNYTISCIVIYIS